MSETPEPWNMTEAQRLQFREAHAEATRRRAEREADTGPYETEQEVLALPAVRAAFDAITGTGTGLPERLAILEQALSGAGVELGAYDRRIADWMAGWEPTTVKVIADWVTRAYEAGKDARDG